MSADREERAGRPSPIVALALSTHPGPTVAVTAIMTALSLGAGLEPWRVACVSLAIFANQASVGLSNDWIDAARDRALGRTDKPIARGWLSVRLVRSVAIALAGLSVALTLPLGVLAVAAHAVFLASGWTYNAGLKSTWFSALPYIVGFGSLPSIVTLSLAEPRAAAGWATAVAALLGLAAHFANVLPDLDDDRRTGVRGLPHALGARMTGLATWGVLGAASVLAFVGPRDGPTVLDSITLVATLTIVVVGTVVVLARPPSRLSFRLIIAAAVISAVSLAIAGQRILA